MKMNFSFLCLPNKMGGDKDSTMTAIFCFFLENMPVIAALVIDKAYNILKTIV